MINSRRIFFFVTVVFVIVITILIESRMVLINSKQYSIAVKFIKSDASISSTFGAIYDLGIPSGKLNSPKGNCYFKVKIKGEFKTGKIGIRMKEYRYGVWKVESWEFL